jgi:glutamine cyclotransferase
MASTLTVDNIVGATSSDNIHIPGHVVQVVNSSMNTSKSTQSTSFVATTHSVTITPKYNNSKIFLNLSGGAWHISAAQSYATFYRGSTNLGDATYGLTQNEQSYSPHSFSFVDTPATTSATTYEVYWRVSNAANISYYSYPNYGTVVLTVMEIAQ